MLENKSNDELYTRNGGKIMIEKMGDLIVFINSLPFGFLVLQIIVNIIFVPILCNIHNKIKDRRRNKAAKWLWDQF